MKWDKINEIQATYGWEGFRFANAIRDEIRFYEKRNWEWDMKIIRNDKYTLIVALICRDGTTFYTFSKFHGVYAGCFTLSTILMEEFAKKAEQMWERELECLGV